MIDESLIEEMELTLTYFQHQIHAAMAQKLTNPFYTEDMLLYHNAIEEAAKLLDEKGYELKWVAEYDAFVIQEKEKRT